MLKIDSKYIQGVQAAKKPEDLHEYMQLAIELEHATIPPYLTAMFSLKRNTNQKIHDVIHSVVIEEMLHMTISSNILLALGGSPAINKKDFVPCYPGPLPMNIVDGLKVGLEQYSKELMWNVFMEIEEPENPLHIKSVKAPIPDDQHTIGQFYEMVKKRILALPESQLPGNPEFQVTSNFFASDELFPIIHKEDAAKAIDIIIEQGEGTQTSPNFDGEVAHYYKFYELYMQQTIKELKDGKYIFGQPSIPFDPTGVHNIKANTKAGEIPEGTEARKNLDEFNATYTRLLNGLHITFNGNPRYLDNTLGLMYDVKLAGEKLCATPFPGETNLYVGPSFEFVTLPQSAV